MSKEQYLFKNSINLNAIRLLSVNIEKVYEEFNSYEFNQFFKRKLKTLTLTERIGLVTDGLYKFLPYNYETAVPILIKSLPPELPNYNTDNEKYDSSIMNGLNGFIISSLTGYISRYGLDHFDLSMNAFYHMTKCFTAEGPIRYFIKQYPKKSLKIFKKWSKDNNMHVRRLVSESIRPRLPWAMGLPEFVKDPAPILPLLELLKNDKELYVRRSVANNLNDIAKDNPEIVTKLLAGWSKDQSDNSQWLIKHALRTLLKTGDKKALSLLGYHHNAEIDVSKILIKKSKIILGDSLNFTFTLKSTSKKDQRLMIDYLIHHKKSNGKLKEKVFKLKKVNLLAGKEIKVLKKHTIKEISTRKYYEGNHEIQLQINGMLFDKKIFHLQLPKF